MSDQSEIQPGLTESSAPSAPTAPVAAHPASPALASAALLRIGIFFLLLSLSLVAMHLLVNTGLRRIKTSSFGVSNRIVNGQVNADILIAGSSRALVHYDPRIIQAGTGASAFNIGLNGAQTDMQLARLRTYLLHNRPPRLLIFNLDLFSFQTTHDGVYDPGQHLPYLGEQPLYTALHRINPEIWKSRYLPLYGYVVEDMRFTWMTGFKGLLGINPPEDHYLGFVPRYLEWTGEFEEFQHSNTNGVEFAIQPEGVREMREIIELCQRQGTTVVLIYSPEYKAIQALTRNRPEIFAQFGALARQYQVEFWDYSEFPICEDRQLFYNSQHLNAEGAIQFTEAVTRRLVASGLVSTTAVHQAASAQNQP